ncbi:hypothetical protein KVR01_013595 [Diaporthe batatas]|uniref:uncharacterized protein n=1 Tax=Diaporthe batatas TaxID=748121 RepID=UPI001D051065|nr:uncharacterized protein KVR01_013595 [Diaporthe batatas]KAG8156491.1 hypothetical protein KVR01_013595 [Diaporthe batatas]
MATKETTVFITGANRGIGRALAEAYLSRPNHVVIGSVRNPDTTTLRDYVPAPGSKLLLVKIEATSLSDPAEAVKQLGTEGITSLDIVIANAGINPVSAFAPVANIQPEDFRRLFEVNALSFVTLFGALHPLLLAALPSPPKLLAITSNASQLGDVLPLPVASYGASKAVLNYLVRHIHVENPWLTAWIMNPGFVQTDTGYEAARAAGMETPPHTLAQSTDGLLQKLDSATRQATSGNFYNFDGTELSY